MNPNYPFVSARARHVCEYCRAPEVVFNLPFEVEHITPQARGGETIEQNLALSCRSCNLYKSDLVNGIDSRTNTETALFHPRREEWREHFSLNAETGEIEALTATGRATVMRLRINSRSQTEARRQWIKLGLMI
ncbi:MAG: HNH endonuclease [Acidobacteriota bacterium]|nr:HNH endonuclease [Acidobacteriota bacterium]